MTYDPYYQFRVSQGSEFIAALRRKEAQRRLKGRERSAGRPMPDFCDNCDEPRPPKKPLHYDHDHKTGQFRGWLCTRCNTGLGLLGDTIETVERALNYLKRARK